MEDNEFQGSDVEDSDPVVTLKSGVNFEDLLSSNGMEFEVNLSDIERSGIVSEWFLIIKQKSKCLYQRAINEQNFAIMCHKENYIKLIQACMCVYCQCVLSLELSSVL